MAGEAVTGRNEIVLWVFETVECLPGILRHTFVRTEQRCHRFEILRVQAGRPRRHPSNERHLDRRTDGWTARNVPKRTLVCSSLLLAVSRV